MHGLGLNKSSGGLVSGLAHMSGLYNSRRQGFITSHNLPKFVFTDCTCCPEPSSHDSEGP